MPECRLDFTANSLIMSEGAGRAELVVRDIDWSVSLVMSSSKVGVLDEPILNLVLGNGTENIELEMNKEELEKMIAMLKNVESELDR